MFAFADSFDLYTATNPDLGLGYWDTIGPVYPSLVAGRFAGSRALSTSASGIVGIKSSGNNDAVHHVAVAVQYNTMVSPATFTTWSLTLGDGATAQCTIAFRNDGSILLQTGAVGGATLATYPTAIVGTGIWTQFEFEVVINNTTGSFTARKNGNTSNDFTQTGLNTRGGTANNYASRLTLSQSWTGASSLLDDLIWKSDPTFVGWMGDVRSYTRMPASDASKQFAGLPMSVSVPVVSTLAITAGVGRYTGPLTAPVTGTIGSLTVTLSVGYTGNMKCSLFSVNTVNQPASVLGSATAISNPVAGNNTFTFGTPVAVTQGQQFIVGFDSDTTSGTWTTAGGSLGSNSTTAYASFPVANPTVTGLQQAITCTVAITPTVNATLVNEAQQDGIASYAYDATVNDQDYYAIAPRGTTSTAIACVVTRGLVEKSDAGARSGTMQLKSGAAVVNTGTLALPSSWQWIYRTDMTDPNTASAWTASGVDAVQIGPKVVA